MRLIAALLGALLALPANAQSWATRDVCDVKDVRIHEDAFTPASYAEIQNAAAQIENGVGKFWQITAPGGAVSHLWGTVHLNDPILLALPEQVEQAIKSARVITPEIDFRFASRRDHTAVMQFEGRTPISQKPGFAELQLPDDLNFWIRERFASLGWGFDGPETIRPSAVAEFLLSSPCNDFASWVFPIQDNRIQMIGAIAGAEIIGLEDQNDFVWKLDEDRDLTKAIIATYAAYLNPDWTRQGTETSYALYLEGRLAEWMVWERAYLDDLFPGGQGADWLRLTDGYLLTERNVNFVNAALPELQNGGVFMAVGAFHLPGQTGLVKMLRDAGFSVTRIPVPGEAVR